MNGESKHPITVAVNEYLPINSFKKGWKLLSGTDWSTFFYRLSLVGLAIFLSGAAVILVFQFGVMPLRNGGSLVGFLSSLLSSLTVIAVIFLFFAYLVSLPIDSLTGEIEIAVPGNGPIKLFNQIVITCICFGLVYYCVQFRIAMANFAVDTGQNSIINQAGRLSGPMMLDLLYFGGLLAAIGLLFCTWTSFLLDK